METVCHYLLECPKYEDIRADMMKDLTNTIGLRNINLATLLGQLEGEDKEDYRKKLDILTTFMDKSKRFECDRNLGSQS